MNHSKEANRDCGSYTVQHQCESEVRLRGVLRVAAGVQNSGEVCAAADEEGHLAVGHHDAAGL